MNCGQTAQRELKTAQWPRQPQDCPWLGPRVLIFEMGVVVPQTTMAGTDQMVAMIVPSSLRLTPHRLLSLYTLLQVAGG